MVRYQSLGESSLRFKAVQDGLRRGVSVDNLLAGLGALLRNRADTLPTAKQEELYDLSRPVPAFDKFLSHSWSSPGWQKVVALMLDHLGLPALVAASTAAMAVHVIQNYWELPGTALYVRHDTYFRADVPVSFWEFGLAEAVALLLVFFGHKLYKGTFYFLDCASIHQTDKELKLAGIAHIPDFLRNSGEIVVMWDEEYLTRMWCVYELAVAQAPGARRSIRLLPLDMYTTLALFSLYYAILALGFVLVYPLIPGIWGLHVSTFFCCGSLMALIAHSSAGVAQLIQSIQNAMSNFRVRTTKIFYERDREILNRSIEELYGSLDLFDIEVRTKVTKGVMEAFVGQRAMLPYRAFFGPLTSLFPFWVALCTGYIDKPAEVRVAMYIYAISESVAVFPVCTALAMELGRVVGKPTSGSNYGSYARSAAIGASVAILHGVWVQISYVITMGVAFGELPGLGLKPCHAAPLALATLLPVYAAAVWFFRPRPVEPSGVQG